jgi:hypothetical protein
MTPFPYSSGLVYRICPYCILKTVTVLCSHNGCLLSPLWNASPLVIHRLSCTTLLPPPPACGFLHSHSFTREPFLGGPDMHRHRLHVRTFHFGIVWPSKPTSGKLQPLLYSFPVFASTPAPYLLTARLHLLHLCPGCAPERKKTNTNHSLQVPKFCPEPSVQKVLWLRALPGGQKGGPTKGNQPTKLA